MSQKPYVIMTATTTDGLENVVGKKMSEGYLPIGGIDSRAEGGGGKYTTFAQAMIYAGKEKDKILKELFGISNQVYQDYIVPDRSFTRD